MRSISAARARRISPACSTRRLDAVRLEIGFGGGEHLVAEARAFPHTGFIGCEPYVNGMAKILAQIEAHNIGNIRLFAGDAAELLAWAPPRSLARIDLIHPDPWPKRRHWKRRFVQDATVAAMARALKPDGEFRFVSDIDDYCAWTLAHLLRAPDFVWTAERAARLAPAVGRLHHDPLRRARPSAKAARRRICGFGRSAAKSSVIPGARSANPESRFRIMRGFRVRACAMRSGMTACYGFAASPIRAFLMSVASHTMRLPRSRPNSSIGSRLSMCPNCPL